jgi:hypothetical protein
MAVKALESQLWWRRQAITANWCPGSLAKMQAIPAVAAASDRRLTPFVNLIATKRTVGTRKRGRN